MRNLITITLVFLILFACGKAPVNTSTMEKDIINGIAGQDALDYYRCGQETVIALSSHLQMTVSNNIDIIEITLSTSGNWILDKSQIYVGYLQNIPTNNNGTYKPSNFPYRITHPWDTNLFKIRIPKTTLTGNIVIVVAGETSRVNKTSCQIYETVCNPTSINTILLNPCIEI
jgi:hypothetical protein